MRADVSEATFEDGVVALATLHGWRIHCERPAFSKDGEHVSTAIKGQRGFPDVTAAHPQLGIVFAELKSATGHLGAGQPEWIRALLAFDTETSDVLVEIWRPADWEAVEVCFTAGVRAYRARFRNRPMSVAPVPTLGT